MYNNYKNCLNDFAVRDQASHADVLRLASAWEAIIDCVL